MFRHTILPSSESPKIGNWFTGCGLQNNGKIIFRNKGLTKYHNCLYLTRACGRETKNNASFKHLLP